MAGQKDSGWKDKIFKRFFAIIWLAAALFLPGLVFAQSRATVTYYYTDPQGTVLATADEQGNIVESYEYRPFGGSTIPLKTSGPSFTGHVNDVETGLLYAQQRYIDPDVGRFISVDPVGVSAGVDRGLNRYWYGNNNPYRFNDPDGREVTCYGDTCTASSHSLIELAVDYSTLAALYTKRLVENAVHSKQTNQSPDDVVLPVATPEPGTAESEEGCIYCVDGVNTPSGKPYVGSADDLDRRAATAKDGRDRSDATKVDSYKKGDRTDRQNKEQKVMNEKGGRDVLDNKRNEVSPDKWKDRNIPPPNSN